LDILRPECATEQDTNSKKKRHTGIERNSWYRIIRKYKKEKLGEYLELSIAKKKRNSLG
jgi:hypothetical protein